MSPPLRMFRSDFDARVAGAVYAAFAAVDERVGFNAQARRKVFEALDLWFIDNGLGGQTDARKSNWHDGLEGPEPILAFQVDGVLHAHFEVAGDEFARLEEPMHPVDVISVILRGHGIPLDDVQAKLDAWREICDGKVEPPVEEYQPPKLHEAHAVVSRVLEVVRRKGTDMPPWKSNPADVLEWLLYAAGSPFDAHMAAQLAEIRRCCGDRAADLERPDKVIGVAQALSVLPMVTTDDEATIVSSVSGGADEVDGMPRMMTLVRGQIVGLDGPPEDVVLPAKTAHYLHTSAVADQGPAEAIERLLSEAGVVIDDELEAMIARVRTVGDAIMAVADRKGRAAEQPGGES